MTDKYFIYQGINFHLKRFTHVRSNQWTLYYWMKRKGSENVWAYAGDFETENDAMDCIKNSIDVIAIRACEPKAL